MNEPQIKLSDYFNFKDHDIWFSDKDGTLYPFEVTDCADMPIEGEISLHARLKHFESKRIKFVKKNAE